MPSNDVPKQSQQRQPAMGARVLASCLFYGQAVFLIVSMLAHWQMTRRLDLNLNFLFLIWCGHAIARQSRAAVNWGLIIAGLSVFIGGLEMYFALYDPTGLDTSHDALTPSVIRTALVAGIEYTLWGLIAWNQLRVISRREEISFRTWFDPWLTVKAVLALGLIAAIIPGWNWLNSWNSPPLANQVPITDSQAEQVKILKERYKKQIEFLQALTRNPELKREKDYWEKRQELFNDEPGIIDGRFESVHPDGVSSMTEGFSTGYTDLSFSIVPGYYPTGTVTLNSGKRYSVIEYSDFVQNDDGVWLKYKLIVRQDHLQESEPDFE